MGRGGVGDGVREEDPKEIDVRWRWKRSRNIFLADELGVFDSLCANSGRLRSSVSG